MSLQTSVKIRLFSHLFCAGESPAILSQNAIVANWLLRGNVAIISLSAYRSASDHLLQMMQSSGMAAF
jgi:hypothetical protein